MVRELISEDHKQLFVGLAKELDLFDRALGRLIVLLDGIDNELQAALPVLLR